MSGETVFLRVGIDGTGSINGARVVKRSLDDISNSATLTNSNIDQLNKRLSGIGSNANNVQSLNNHLKNTASAAKSAALSIQDIENMLYRIVIRTAALAAVYGTIRLITNGFREAIAAVNDFQVSVIQIAASLTQIGVNNGMKDIPLLYQESTKYANALVLKMQEIDPLTLANNKGLMSMLQVMTAQGVVLDINNKKQVQSFTDVSNAIATMTAGQNQEMQMYQEMRSLLSGRIDMHSQLARVIDMQMKQQGTNLKEQIKLGRENLDIFERLAPYLKGINAASQDISKTWEAVKTSFQTALNIIQREAFTSIVKDIGNEVNRLNTYLKANSTTIGQSIKNAWNDVYSIIKTIRENSDTIINTFQVLAKAAEVWAGYMMIVLSSKVIGMLTSWLVVKAQLWEMEIKTQTAIEAGTAVDFRKSAGLKVLAAEQLKVAESNVLAAQAESASISAKIADSEATRASIVIDIEQQSILAKMMAMQAEQLGIEALVADAKVRSIGLRIQEQQITLSTTTAHYKAQIAQLEGFGLVEVALQQQNLLKTEQLALTRSITALTQMETASQIAAAEAHSIASAAEAKSSATTLLLNQQKERLVGINVLLSKTTMAHTEALAAEATAQEALNAAIKRTGIVAMEAKASVLTLSNAVSVLTALWIGWEVGSMLNKFEIVRKAGVNMVYGIVFAWHELETAWDRFKATINPFGDEDEQQAKLAKITSNYDKWMADFKIKYNSQMKDVENNKPVMKAIEKLTAPKGNPPPKEESDSKGYKALFSARQALDDAYKNWFNEQNKLRLNEIKNQGSLELQELENQHKQMLISDKDYIETKYNINQQMYDRELEQQKTALDKAKVAMDNAADIALRGKPDARLYTTKGVVNDDAKNAAILKQQEDYWKKSEDFDKQKMAYNDLLNKGELVTLKYRQETYDYSITAQQVLNDAASEGYQKTITNLKEILDLENSVNAVSASLVGTNSAGEFDTISDQIANQMAMQVQAHTSRMKDIQDERDANLGALMAGKKSFQEYDDFVKLKVQETANLKKQNEQAITKITQDGYKSQTSEIAQYASYASQMFATIADAQEQSSRKGFESAKAFNLAAAVMSTAAGIMSVFAQSGDVNFYMKLAQAAAVAASGAVQIAKIASTSFGGGGSVAAPSGGSSGSGGGGNSSIPNPMIKMQDSRSDEVYERLIASTDNTAVAIGRLSKSMDELSSIFQSGGTWAGLAINAPGSNTVSSGKDVGGNAFGKWFGDTISGGSVTIGDGNWLGALGNIVGGGMGSLKELVSTFESENRLINAGMSLGVKGGKVQGSNFQVVETGNWWTGSDQDTNYQANAELTKAANQMLEPYIDSIENMAITLGTKANISDYDTPSKNINTAGQTAEQRAEALENWMNDVLEGMAGTVYGLSDVMGSYENAYDVLRKYNDALVSTNFSLELIGKTTVQGSLANAKMLTALQEGMGGQEKFAESIDTYFSSMFSDFEQESMRVAQAERIVNRTFIEMETILTELGTKAPTTKTEFVNLVDSLDLTTTTGQKAFAALMDVSESFSIFQNAADKTIEKIKEIASATEDLAVRNLSAMGQSIAAQRMSNELDMQRAIQDAEKNNMGADYINNLKNTMALEAAAWELQSAIEVEKQNISDRQAEQAEAIARQADKEKERLQAKYNSDKQLLEDLYDTQVESSKKVIDSMSDSVSKLKSFADSLKSTLEDMRPYSMAEAQALVDKAIKTKNISNMDDLSNAVDTMSNIDTSKYATALDYQRDQIMNATRVESLKKIADGQLSTAEQQLQYAKDQLELLKTNHETELELLKTKFDEQNTAVKTTSNDEIAALDKQYDAAITQISALYNINNSVLSVASAFSLFTTAVKTAMTPTSTVPAVAAADSYNQPTKATYSLVPSGILGTILNPLLHPNEHYYQNDLTGVKKWVADGTLPTFKNGGISDGPSIFGEAGREAAIPIPNGYIPVRITGGNDDYDELVKTIKEMERVIAALLVQSNKNTKVVADQVDEWGATSVTVTVAA